MLLGLTGCTGLDEASAAPLTQDDLVTELAAQLTTGSGASYTASYQLIGGETARIVRAQQPTRTAYEFPGGRLLVTAASTIHCKGETCTESDPSPTAAAELTSLITPEAVLGMLNAAALSPNVTVQPKDTTIAGRHATCLDIAQVEGAAAREFSACVTNEGALGSFSATIQSTRIDLAMTDFSDRPDTSAFLLPHSAKLTDKRTK